MTTDGSRSAHDDPDEGDVRAGTGDELTAADAAILDALYADADADAGAALDAMQRSTLAGWRDVRGVVRHARAEGFDPEPPAAGRRGSLETLMAMARARAPAPKQAWWARLLGRMAPVLAHPALAGAAALVVVGGAAGVLYMKGKARVARPPASERAPLAPGEEPSPPSPEGELRDVLERHPPADRPGPARTDDGDGRGSSAGAGASTAEGAAIGAGAGAVAPGGSSPTTSGTPGGGKAPPKPTAPRKPSSTAPTGLDEAALLEEDEGVRFEQPLGQASGEGATAPETPAASVGPQVTTDSVTPPPPPAPPAPTARPPSRPTTATAQIARDDDAAPTAAQHAQAVKLTEQARAAAKRGDCATVAAASKQVATLDPGHHRDVFVRDPDVARCR
jgi:hypothetical protein